MFERSPATSCGGQVFLATGAGLCFLVSAIGVAGVLVGFAEDLLESRPLDGLLVARAVIGLTILGGAVAFVALGLSMTSDFLPPRGLASRPLRYAATVVLILMLAALAIPLLPIALLAWGIVATAGPLVDWLLTRRCVNCALARWSAVGLDPVFCERHYRFFGGDIYRTLLSRDVD